MHYANKHTSKGSYRSWKKSKSLADDKVKEGIFADHPPPVLALLALACPFLPMPLLALAFAPLALAPAPAPLAFALAAAPIRDKVL